MNERLTFSTAGVNLHHGELVQSDDGFAPLQKKGADFLLLQEVIDPYKPIDQQHELLEQRLADADYTLIKAFGELAIAAKNSLDIEVKAIHTAQLQRIGKFAWLSTKLLSPKQANRHLQRFRRDVLAASLTLDGEPLTLVSSHFTTAPHIKERANQEGRFGAFVQEFSQGGSDALGIELDQHAVIAKIDGNHFFNPQKAMQRIGQHSNLTPLVIDGDTYHRRRAGRHFYLRGYPKPVQLDSGYYTANTLKPLTTELMDLKDTDHYGIYTLWERSTD